MNAHMLQLPLLSPFAIAVAIAVAVTIASTPSPSLVCPLRVLIVVSSGGQCHRYQRWCRHCCHGIITYCTIFVKSALKTSDKKSTNGDHHAMLKVIQHGVTIAKFRSDHSRRLQINQKIAPWRRAIIELSIKQPFFFHHLSIFSDFVGLPKIRSPTKKQNGINLAAGPPK
jgi:hypothetical protein